MTSRLLFVIPLLWASSSVRGSESGAAEDGMGSNIFSGGEFGMSIFTLLIFFGLFFILRKWAWAPLLDGLRRRENHIRQSIEETELAREEAFLSLRQYESRIGQAQTEAQAIIDAARKQAAELSEQLKQKAEADAEMIRQRAQHDLIALREQAIRLISSQAAELTTSLASQIVKRQLSAEDHRGLIQESLSKLEQTIHAN